MIFRSARLEALTLSGHNPPNPQIPSFPSLTNAIAPDSRVPFCLRAGGRPNSPRGASDDGKVYPLFPLRAAHLPCGDAFRDEVSAPIFEASVISRSGTSAMPSPAAGKL